MDGDKKTGRGRGKRGRPSRAARGSRAAGRGTGRGRGRPRKMVNFAKSRFNCCATIVFIAFLNKFIVK